MGQVIDDWNNQTVVYFIQQFMIVVQILMQASQRTRGDAPYRYSLLISDGHLFHALHINTCIVSFVSERHHFGPKFLTSGDPGVHLG